MYKLEYLPAARNDLLEIAGYISRTLENPAAAERIVKSIIEKGETLTVFPYLYPVYIPIRPLKYEYRKVKVKNYYMFYWVDEEVKTITVARVIYAKRDYEKWL